MTAIARRLRALIALAGFVAALVAPVAAFATLTEAQVWKSPAWNVPGLLNTGSPHTYGGASYTIRQSIVQYSGWSPAPLPPPGFPPAVTPGTMAWVRVTGLGTTEIGVGYYGVDSSRNEMQLRCQTTGMADTYGSAGNPQLVSTSSIQCSIYTHPVGAASWTYRETGMTNAGQLVYRPMASGGYATGYWIATVNIAGGGTFVAWIN